jgi:hypothetical protein
VTGAFGKQGTVSSITVTTTGPQPSTAPQPPTTTGPPPTTTNPPTTTTKPPHTYPHQCPRNDPKHNGHKPKPPRRGFTGGL